MSALSSSEEFRELEQRVARLEEERAVQGTVITSMDDDIRRSEQRHREVTLRLTSVQTTLTEHTARLDGLDDRVRSLGDDVEVLRTEMRTGFGAIMQHLAQQDRRLSDHDGRFEAIDGRFDGMDRRFDTLTESVQYLVGREQARERAED